MAGTAAKRVPRRRVHGSVGVVWRATGRTSSPRTRLSRLAKEANHGDS